MNFSNKIHYNKSYFISDLNKKMSADWKSFFGDRLVCKGLSDVISAHILNY